MTWSKYDKCKKPQYFICHKEGGYNKNHYVCQVCTFNLGAPYKRGFQLKVSMENLYWRWVRLWRK